MTTDLRFLDTDFPLPEFICDIFFSEFTILEFYVNTQLYLSTTIQSTEYR